ncbi:helix-turn-helix domain-containing protein [Telmatocola sphagniphila]|uniref:Helix-turn-helix domain-containing protein n=2 Tax=Telmatocola sphagniphila TaxID=1123043 RepID=A0A8E6EZ97_9BACT|nr:helix-turn-helix domain-containing protein [Telmatocola sphagniphila]
MTTTTVLRAPRKANETNVPKSTGELVTVNDIAALLGCTWRTVYRMADEGKIPFGLKIGGLRRWHLGEFKEWIAAGAKPVRSRKRGRVEA